ncbi:collagenase [Streptomyces sp. NPDC005151]
MPGYYGEGLWYRSDRVTAVDEGTAEFFDGDTRDDGVAVRKSMVSWVIRDTAGGRPRMTVNQVLHATYGGDGSRIYPYAATFFEFLWTERPGLLQEMYRHLRADDPAAFDAWRDRLGTDAALQRAYDAFLDEQIAKVDQLFVPNTTFTPNEQLRDSSLKSVRRTSYSVTWNKPHCVENGDTGKRSFICTGRITANLKDFRNPDQVFKDMFREGRLLHPRAGRGRVQQLGRHELLLRPGKDPDQRRGRYVHLLLRRTAAQLTRKIRGVKPLAVT